METYYLEKMDKPISIIDKIRKIKIEENNCKIYEKKFNKVVKKMEKREIQRVVLAKELHENEELINLLNSKSIKIFDGRWLMKYITFEILEFILKKQNIKKVETQLAITTNDITDIVIENIKKLSKEFKRLTVVTRHIDKLKKIEEEIYIKEGILIIVSNNPKKSLAKADVILNMDFNKEMLNKYKIKEDSIIINLEGNMKIKSKRFNGIVVNDYEIKVKRKEDIWKANMEKFKEKELLEAVIFRRDTYSHIRNIIKTNKIEVSEIIGINGKI